MHAPGYWKQHYAVASNPDEVERHLGRTAFASAGRSYELLRFGREANGPCVLVSPGSAGHAYVFAELAYQLSLRGLAVFVMPQQGGEPLSGLVQRHRDAVAYLRRQGHARVGAFGEGLGSYAVFYLALAGELDSQACQNGPAICTERAYRAAISTGTGAALRRRLALPLLEALRGVAPKLPVPIALYLDFPALVDRKAENWRVEAPLIAAYGRDPDFDRWYPLDAVLSLLHTPPPAPLSSLTTPTLFVVPDRGITPEYERDLFRRLPPITRRLVNVDDGVFWMCAHPVEAAELLAGWFWQTL